MPNPVASRGSARWSFASRCSAPRGRGGRARRSPSTPARRSRSSPTSPSRAARTAATPLAALLWPDYDAEHAAPPCGARCPRSARRSATRWLATQRDPVSLDARAGSPRPSTRPGRLAGEGALRGRRGTPPRPVPRRVRPARQHQLRQLAVVHRGHPDARARSALERAADEPDGAGRLGCRDRAARRRLALDPVNEPAHRRLIELVRGQRRPQRRRRPVPRLRSHALPRAGRSRRSRARRRSTARSSKAPPLPRPASPPRLPGGASTRSSAAAASGRRCGRRTRRSSDDGAVVAIEGEAGDREDPARRGLVASARGAAPSRVTVRCFQQEAELAFGVAIGIVRGALEDGDGGRVDPAAASEAARIVPELGTPADRRRSTIPALRPASTTACAAGDRRDRRPAAAGPASSTTCTGRMPPRSRARLPGAPPPRQPAPARAHVAPRGDAAGPSRAGAPRRRRQGRARADDRPRAPRLGRGGRARCGCRSRGGGRRAPLHRDAGLPFFVVEYLDGLADAGADWPRARRRPRAARGAPRALGELAVAGRRRRGRARALVRPSTPSATRAAAARRRPSRRSRSSPRAASSPRRTARSTSATSRRARVAYERTSLARRRLLHGRAAAALGGAADAASPRGRDRSAPRASPASEPEAAESTASPASAPAASTRTPRRSATPRPRSTSATPSRRPPRADRRPPDARRRLRRRARELRVGRGARPARAGSGALEHRIGARPPPPRRLGARRGSLERALAALGRGAASARAILADRSLDAHRAGRDTDALRPRRGGARARRRGRRPPRPRAGTQHPRHPRHRPRRRRRGRSAARAEPRALAEDERDPARAAALNNLALAAARRGRHRPGARAHRGGPRALRQGRRPPPRGRARVTTPRRPPPRRRPADESHRAQLQPRGRDLRRGRRGGRMEPEIWKLVEW